MIERFDRLGDDQLAAVRQLLAAERTTTTRHPLDEVNRLALEGVVGARDPNEHWLVTGPAGLVGYAVVNPDDVAELTAGDPDAGVELLAAVRAVHPTGSLWTHGDGSSSRSAATALGLRRTRELELMARELPLGRIDRPLPHDVTLAAFDPGHDGDAWLRLNAAAFADLPDQASWTQADLDLRLAAGWFDRTDFLLARTGDGALVGFHWTKVDPGGAGPGVGEVFVIAVAPEWRGTGLAGALLDHGLSHLARRGMRQARLFVDAENTRAIGLYGAAGFRRVDGDRMYAL